MTLLVALGCLLAPPVPARHGPTPVDRVLGVRHRTVTAEEAWTAVDVTDLPPAGARVPAPAEPGPLADAVGAGALAPTALGVAESVRWSEFASLAGPIAGSPLPDGRWGEAVAVADVTGDRIADVIVGAPGQAVGGAHGAGQITLIQGAARGFRTTPVVWNRAPTQSIDGHSLGFPVGADDRFGAAVAIGSFGGPDAIQVAVGIPGSTDGDLARAGVVVAIPIGPDGFAEDRATVVDRSRTPELPGAGGAAGSTLAVGDFDGDGFDDLAVAAPDATVGRRRSAGSVTIVPGGSDGIGSRAAIPLARDQPGVAGTPRGSARFGSALAVGDFDADGFDDLAIGAPGSRRGRARGAGDVTVVFGGADGLGRSRSRLLGQALRGHTERVERGDGFGAALAAGDLDADGYDDLVVGVPGEDIGRRRDVGIAHVMTGSPRGLSTRRAKVISRAGTALSGAPLPRAAFASALAIGDVVGGPADDLVVGVPGDRAGGRRSAGSIQIVPGSSSGLDLGADLVVDRRTPGVSGTPGRRDRFGSALAIGDISGDGDADIVATAPLDSLSPGLRSAGSLTAIDARWPDRAIAHDRPDDLQGPQVHVVYAIPSDAEPARTIDAAIRSDVAVVDSWVRTQLGDGTGIRWDTVAGALDLSVVRLDRSEAQIASGRALHDDARNVYRSLARLGFDGPDHDGDLLLVYYEGLGTDPNTCGLTFPELISVLWLQACGGVFPEFTSMPQGATYVAVHELTHGLGAVADGAPHSDGSGHVDDDPRDVLYKGLSARDWDHLTLDPGNDDYLRHDGAWADIADSPLLG